MIEVIAYQGPTTDDYEDLRAATHAALFCLEYEPDDKTRRVNPFARNAV